MILIFGPPGSGKGTQAEMLEEKFKLKWFSVGQLFREHGDEDDHAKMKAGILISDEKTQKLLEKALSEVDKDEAILLDGYPRRESQVPWLLSLLKDSNRRLKAILVIHIPLEETIKRNMLRGRADDSEETIRVRYEQYENEMNDIIYKFEEQGHKVNRIEGVGTVREVHERACKTLDGVVDVYQS